MATRWPARRVASTTHYWRAFDMNTFTGGLEYDITSVEFGIELAQSATGTGQSVTVNLYTNSGSPFPNGTLTKIATSGLLNIPDQADVIFNLPITASVPAGTLELVMEVVAPDGDPTNNVFFIGSNPDPETRTSYISAADCGTPDPVPVADIGFPDMHYVINVNGSCPAGSPTPTATATATPPPRLRQQRRLQPHDLHQRRPHRRRPGLHRRQGHGQRRSLVRRRKRMG